ncbi:MAG: TetR/AcrR family transcriptional regulator [Lachnospiraceae bacterium]|nr:TetR/AcrR family transcriptional regulator [Lachnospiraceae bacterium]
MRKKDDSMRSTLLELACQIADSEGLDAVNIRSLAGRAGIATGTVYNYFSCKDEILLALTEEYWRQALLQMKTVITADSFCGQLLEIFTFLQEQIDRSAGKLMSSLGNIEATGHARMASMQSELISALIHCLEQDTHVRRDIWNETFTKERFARYIMMNLLMLLKTETPDVDFFITMINRTIY